MNLQDLLNADVSSIGEWIRQGFSWWIDELSTLLPASWREGLSSRPKRLIEPLSPSGWRYWQNGRVLGEAQAMRATGGAVGLILPSDAVLLRRLELPRLPLSDVRRLVALDIDRLSPLAADLVFHDLEVIDRDVGDGKQAVLLGVVPRDVVLRNFEALREEGVEPSLIGAAVAEGAAGYRFDFLPAVKSALGESDGRNVIRYWWGAVALLLIANLGVLVGRDVVDVSRLQHTVDDQHVAVSAASQLRRRVQIEEAQRQDLINRQLQSDPLRVLDALSRTIPAGAWVQRLEWNGQTVRVVGFKTGDADPLAALKANPGFANPRAANGEGQAKPGANPPFDITVDVPKRSQP